MQFRTFIDSSTESGASTIQTVSSGGSAYGVGISSDVSCRNIEISSAGIENANVSTTVLTGTIDLNVLDGSIIYYTQNASADWTFNIRANSSTTLDSFLSIGKIITVTVLSTQGSSAKYATTFKIDGATITPKWQGGTTPSSGFASSINIYTYVIIKTAAATFTVLASLTKFS